MGGSDLINMTKQAKGYSFYEKMQVDGASNMEILKALWNECRKG
jgi:hypothetical protein